MIDLQLNIKDLGKIAALKKHLSQTSDIVAGIVLRTVNESQLGSDILSDFQAEPGSVHKPIEWTSAKQRRYVMMKIRKGEIKSPYVRSHVLSKGWKFFATRESKNTTTLNLENDTPYADYVEGKHQQRFHANTGWFQDVSLARKWLPVIRKAIIDGIRAALIYRGP